MASGAQDSAQTTQARASKSPEPAADSSLDILPASHWASTSLPPEDDSDADSSFGSDAASSTASITSSVLNYRTINGRTYHAERGNAAYWGANDERQIESMDLYAHLGLITLKGKLHKSPLDGKTLKKALDIGTGTGIWAMDFADLYPDCEVTGTDISPIQPGWVPPNLKFVIENCTEGWSFDDNTFDFVHMRYLYGSIPDWDELLGQAYRVCKPGGWVESHDSSPVWECDDGTLSPNSASAQWGKIFLEAGRKMGRTFEVIQNDLQIKGMEKAGLEDIQVLDVKTPVGWWPKDEHMNELGRVTLATVEQDYEGYISYIANLVLGWNSHDVTIYCAHVRRELRNPKIHAYFRQRIVIGRKPLEPKQKE